MKVAEIMHPHVIAAPVGSTVADLLPLFFEKRLNSLPVLNAAHKLVGIVARDDVLRLLYPDYQVYIRDILSFGERDVFDNDFGEVLQIKTKDIMQKTLLTATATTPVMQALAHMIAHHVDQLPVVTTSGRLTGIITKSDIFYALYKTNKKRIHG